MVRRLGRVLAASVLLGGLAGAAVVQQASSAGAAGGPVAFTILVTGDPECELARVDLSDGTVTAIGSSSNDRCVGDLAETTDGRLFGIQQNTGATTTVHLIQFDTTTGAPTDLGAIGGSPADIFGRPGDGGIAFDKTGALFVAMVGDDPSCNGDAVCLYRVDPAHPATATFVGLGTGETLEQALTVACTGGAMILAESELERGSTGFGATASDTTTTTTGEVSDQAPEPPPVQAQFLGTDAVLNARSLANGSMTPIGGVGADNIVTGLEFDSTGKLWGIGGTSSNGQLKVFTVDPATGVATPVADLTMGGERLEADPINLALPLTCATAATPLPTAAFTG